MFLASATISEALPLITVGLWERTKSVAVFVRMLVAPTPTGSSTQTFPSSWAFAAALCMELTHGLERVPMLITSAEAKDTNSSTSSAATKLIFLVQYLSTNIAATLKWERAVWTGVSGEYERQQCHREKPGKIGKKNKNLLNNSLETHTTLSALRKHEWTTKRSRDQTEDGCYKNTYVRRLKDMTCFKRAMSRLRILKKTSASFFQVRHLQSLWIFAILNDPHSVLICFSPSVFFYPRKPSFQGLRP